MANMTFSQEEISDLVNKIKNELVPVLLQELEQKQLPPLLNRKQFMEVTGISSTKCNELFNRADFPVNREFGHPRVPTKQLFEWVSATTQRNEDTGLDFPYRVL